MDTLTAEQAGSELRQFADLDKAKFLPQFFQAFPGGYGEGDQFLGVKVPRIRTVARSCRQMPLEQVEILLQSVWHEERLLALIIMVERFKGAEGPVQLGIHQLYLKHLDQVNNWDLVDTSAPTLLGAALPPDTPLLDQLASSENVWHRRIAILSTFSYIRQQQFARTLHLAEQLLEDPHPIMHKAVGWMLREVGNRNEAVLRKFLNQHYPRMPRTMLRYAIEKLPEALRQDYLRSRV